MHVCADRELGCFGMHKRGCNREICQGEPFVGDPLSIGKMRVEHLRGRAEHGLAASNLRWVGIACYANHLLGDTFSTNDAHCWSEMVRRPDAPPIDRKRTRLNSSH